jgi:hypothetical protein
MAFFIAQARTGEMAKIGGVGRVENDWQVGARLKDG